MAKIGVQLGEGFGVGVPGDREFFAFEELEAGVEVVGRDVGLVEYFGGVGTHLGEEGAAGGVEVGEGLEEGALFVGGVGEAAVAEDGFENRERVEPGDRAVGESLTEADFVEERGHGLVIGVGRVCGGGWCFCEGGHD